MSTPIGTLGTIPSINIAGRVFTDLTNLIRLNVWGNTNAASTFRLSSGTSGYQVTSGKTLTIYAVTVINAAPGVNVPVGLIYSDNDLGFNVGTTPTNEVNESGDIALLPYVGDSVASVGTWKNEYISNFSIPQNKYPGIRLGALGNVINLVVYGYEV